MKSSHRRWPAPLAFSILLLGGSAGAIDTATIAASTLSPECLAYRPVGICFWLHCSTFGCEVRTSTKIRHYIPDAVVAAYNNTGANPWAEVTFMSPATSSARSGGDGTTDHRGEDDQARFKNADVIGHPGASIFNEFAGTFGDVCQGAGQAFMPNLLSTFDTIPWRYNIPESFFPEALTPGLREVGSFAIGNIWGNVYPRGGFLHQVDDHKAAAVVAQRAADIVTRIGQAHLYRPLLATPRPGYWPAGAVFENDERSGKWQELVPTVSRQCAVFPNNNARGQARDGGYVWAIWRPYSCCRPEGIFLGFIDYAGN